MPDLQRVGPVPAGTGSDTPFRADNEAAQVTTDGHGRYNEAVRRGKVWFASNQAGIAATAGLSATSTVFTLYNPLGSNTILSVLDVTVQATVDAVADAAIWLVANVTPTQAAPATVTALAVRNAQIGNPATGTGIAYSTATLAAAPVVIRTLPGFAWGTAVGFGQVYARDEVAGIIQVLPGTYISIQASAAITLAASIYWEELDARIA